MEGTHGEVITALIRRCSTALKNERLYRLRRRLRTARPSRWADERARDAVADRVRRLGCLEGSRLSIASGGTWGASVAFWSSSGAAASEKKGVSLASGSCTGDEKCPSRLMNTWSLVFVVVRRARWGGLEEKAFFPRRGEGGGGVDVFVLGLSGLDNSAKRALGQGAEAACWLRIARIAKQTRTDRSSTGDGMRLRLVGVCRLLFSFAFFFFSLGRCRRKTRRWWRCCCPWLS